MDDSGGKVGEREEVGGDEADGAALGRAEGGGSGGFVDAEDVGCDETEEDNEMDDEV